MTALEIELMVAGLPDIDVDDMIAYLEGPLMTDPQFSDMRGWFEAVLRDMDVEQVQPRAFRAHVVPSLTLSLTPNPQSNPPQSSPSHTHARARTKQRAKVLSYTTGSGRLPAAGFRDLQRPL